MISFELDPAHQSRLDSLAASQGKDGATLAQQVLLDYLDFQAWPADSEEDWAESSIAMTPEVMDKEDWGHSGDGP